MNSSYKQYIDSVKYKNGKKYIYGAGKVGQAIYHLCVENEIEIQGFCVTNTEQNESRIEDIPVIEFGSSIEENSVILIGVLEHGKSVIKEYINKYGNYQVVDCPDGILYTTQYHHNKMINPTLEITPAIGCSVNCKYCPQEVFLKEYFRKENKRKKYMTLDDFKICIDKLPKNALIEWAGFVEPFLNNESIDMMQYAFEQGYEMTLYTTLIGMTKKKLMKIISMPFKQVVLHVADKDGYANIPVTDEYLELLEIIINAKKKDGTPFVDNANCQSEPHPKVLEKTKDKIRIYGEMSDRAGNLENKDNKLRGGEKCGRIYCERAVNLNHNVLLPDGTVVLCCNDFGMKHVLGNLLKEDYDSIISSEQMRLVKRGMNLDESLSILCRKCMFAKNLK